MNDTPKTHMAARRIGAAAARWKSGEINAVAFADAVDRFADAVAELERENTALREQLNHTVTTKYHDQIVQESVSLRVKETAELGRENAALRADKQRLDWLQNSPYWPHPPLGEDVRAAIDAARKEIQS